MNRFRTSVSAKLAIAATSTASILCQSPSSPAVPPPTPITTSYSPSPSSFATSDSTLQNPCRFSSSTSSFVKFNDTVLGSNPHHSEPLSGGPDQGGGVITTSHRNIADELESPLPILLYFHITNHPDVVEYTKQLAAQVRDANHRYRDKALEVFAEAYVPSMYQSNAVKAMFQREKGLALKLLCIDCQKEPVIAQKYNIDPHQFPMLLFCQNKTYLDRLSGMVPEVQAKEAIDLFVKHACEEAIKQAKKRREVAAAERAAEKTVGAEVPKGGGPQPQQRFSQASAASSAAGSQSGLHRMDNDDENPMTLLQVAHQKLRVKEIVRARQLYAKSLKMAQEMTAERKVKMGFDGKRRETKEMWDDLRRDGAYNACAQSMAGLAMCEVAERRYSDGLAMVSRIRSEFPYATKDLRDVAEAVVRIELLFVSGYDLDTDNYISLLKFEDLQNDPVTFYQQRVKLAVAHVLDKKHRAAILECVKLIRAEPKLLPALKSGKVVEEDASLTGEGRAAATPARRVLFLIFEVLGNMHETTVEGRKMVEPYL